MLGAVGSARVMTAVQGAAIAMIVVAGSLTAALTHRAVSAPPGHLALLLSTGRAAVVAGHVAPSARGALGATALRDVWTAAVDAAGPLRHVSRSYVVSEGGHVQDELEVLQFADGTGTLAARRARAGIVGLYILVGTATGPPAATAATAASAYAQDLVAGRLQPLRADFDPEMAAALTADLLSAETAAALSGLRAPVTVRAQVVVRRGATTVVETYLLFRNGLRRVEVTLDTNGSIAGLYIRPL